MSGNWHEALAGAVRPRASLFSTFVIAAALATGAKTQEPGPGPEVVWQGEKPAFVGRVYLSDRPDGEPLRSERGPLAEEPGFYVRSGPPLYFVAEVEPVPSGARICLLWTDPNDEPEAESCDPISSIPGRLSFRGPETDGWPTGRYQVRLTLSLPPDGLRPALEVTAEMTYTLQRRLVLLSAGPPDDRPVDVVVTGGQRDIGLPQFPWPPPPPTTQVVIDRALVVRTAGTFGEVADRLIAALDSIDYSERSFYAVQGVRAKPSGFALATRLEQIEFDGTPKRGSERWSPNMPPRDLFTLDGILEALFSAPEGHYRVIVFVVTDSAFVASGQVATRDIAERWLRGGANRLPPAVARLTLNEEHYVTALIYQFRKVGQGGDITSNPDGAEPALRHLERSGIIAALER